MKDKFTRGIEHAASAFSDILAWVRRAMWAGRYFNASHSKAEPVILPRDPWDALLDQLASAA